MFSEINKYFYYLFSDKVTFRQTAERRRGGNRGETWEESIPCSKALGAIVLGVSETQPEVHVGGEE